jgi:xanthine dehydrogenase accessory factor
MNSFFLEIHEYLATHSSAAVVTLLETRGSVPQQPGTRILVGTDGYVSGTIGGGKLEFEAIKKAQKLINDNSIAENIKPSPVVCLQEWNLDSDLNMSCGGVAKLFFEIYHQNVWRIHVFGAGHISQVMVPLLVRLDCNVECFDTRIEWLNKFTAFSNLKIHHLENWSELPVQLKPSDFILVQTPSQDFDEEVLINVLKNQVYFTGAIGSRKKASRMKSSLSEKGISQEKIDSIRCPVGISMHTKNLHEISLSILAQLLQERENLYKQ